MKSPFTGGGVIRQVNQEELEFRNEKFIISYNNYRCVDTGTEFTNKEIDELNMHLLHSAYRDKHNIPFPEEIKSIRKKYDVSQTKMSAILGFGANTYRNYENGDIPLLANAKLISLASKPQGFIDLVMECDALSQNQKQKCIKSVKKIDSDTRTLNNWMFNNQEPSELTGYKSPSLDKINAMIVFFALNAYVFKVKMNKLLFYADFIHFKNHGYSISGASYQAIQMGPVPHRYGTLFEVGADTGAFSIELVQFDEREGERFVSAPKNNILNILSEEEKSTLVFIKESLGAVKTSELIKYSHEEEAWLANKDEQSIIDYNYAFKLKHPADV
ncbi:MAG: DUF4065 domain-containing protein [Balneola sp.]